MNDLLSEIERGEAISIAEALKLVPPGRAGAAPHRATALGWIVRGCPAVDGRTVKLEAVRLGSRWVTTKAAVLRFARNLSTASDAPLLEPKPTPSGRRKAADAAARRLQAAGA